MPIAPATTPVKNAAIALRQRAATTYASSRTLSYQRDEKPGIGKDRLAVALNEKSTTTNNGRNRKAMRKSRKTRGPTFRTRRRRAGRGVVAGRDGAAVTAVIGSPAVRRR